MAGNLLNKYLWLVNLLREEGPVPFKRISEKWRFCSYNDRPGQGLPLKTFHNHCAVISELFGIDVECEKGGNYGYYLPEMANSEKWKTRLLNQLLALSAIKENPSLNDRVINRDFSEDEKHLPRFMDLIKKNSIISFKKPLFETPKEYRQRKGITSKVIHMTGREYVAYQKELIELGQLHENFLVLGVAQVHFTWFVVGAFVQEGVPFEKWRISPFLFHHVKDIAISGEYNSPVPFSMENYLSCFQFDDSDTFKDDRPYLERMLLFNQEYRKFGGLGVFRWKNVKPYPWL